jgi:intein/homing endonuclease
MNKIGLLQINNSFSGQNYFPYSVGLLQAYAQLHCSNISEYEFKDIIYKRIPVNAAVNRLKDCDIIGFSVYVWNEQISLKIASELKKINPTCLIIFGGPQVPDKSENYLKHNLFIDITVHGEGEHVFSLILQNYPSKNWENIPGISYLNNEKFITNSKAGRLKSLDDIPSPYLTGVFDNIIKNNPNEQWLGLWETNRGCPFQCAYCLDGNTYILNSNEVIQPKSEEYIDKFTPCSCGEIHYSNIGKHNSSLIYNGIKDCIKLDLSNGISVTATPDHTIYSVKNDKLTPLLANELKTGDWVALKTGQNTITNNVKINLTVNSKNGQELKGHIPHELDENLAWLTGLLIGDGCIRKNEKSIRFVATLEIEDKIKKLSEKVFGIVPHSYSTGNCNKVKHVELHSIIAVKVFQYIGVTRDDNKLKVPNLIFKSPANVVRAFLNGLWDADGYTPKFKNPISYLTTVSQIFANEVSVLIHWIGDVANINYINTKKYKPNVDYNVQPVYRVYWYSNTLREVDSGKGTTNLASQIPLSHGITPSLKKVNINHNGRTSGTVNRNRLKQFNPNHELLESNLYFVKIKSCSNVKNVHVYDVMNTPDHKLSANGLLSHNCDWGSAIQVKISKFDENRLYREIDWFASHKMEFIFCCDANYGILVRDIDITKYVVNSKIKTGYPMALSVQNTKNATDRSYEVQKLLASVGLNKGVTLSVQSMDKTTLENVKRDNISLESYQELQRRFMKDKIETYSDMILGMPGETYESFIEGIDTIISNGQHNRIQFNNLSILPNAQMGSLEYQKKFGMITVTSDIINIHGSLDEEKNDCSIQEKQVLVIGTNSMPKEKWIQTRAYCWMTSLLYFNKILQIPIIYFHLFTNIRYKDIFNIFMNENYTKNYTILNEIRLFFVNKALDIQNGGCEYCEAKNWLNIWWPADEYIFIKLVKENKIDQFYEECKHLLLELTELNKKQIDKKEFEDTIILNKHLLKLPFLQNNINIDTKSDIIMFYKTYLEKGISELNRTPTKYKIERSKSIYTNWDIWLKEVVWYGNKKGAYLHGNYKTEYQLSGHY